MRTHMTQLTLGDEVLLKLLQELKVQQVVCREGLLSHHSLHCLHVLTNGIVGILCAGAGAWGRGMGGDGRHIHVTTHTCSTAVCVCVCACVCVRVWCVCVHVYVLIHCLHTPTHTHTCTHAHTSWLDTSAWSRLVMPSPMADFIKRERDGRTLIGGYT